ncbi:hypothetical protein EV714DRAFT_205016 [Schizophyllum commune]
MSNLGVQDSSIYTDDGEQNSTGPTIAHAEPLSIPPHPSFTSFGSTSTIIRRAINEVSSQKQAKLPATYLGALAMDTPPVPVRPNQPSNTSGGRKVRVSEHMIPGDARMDGLVPFESLLDVAEHVVFTNLLLSGANDPECPDDSDAPLYTAALKALRGEIEAGGLGRKLDSKARSTLRSVQTSMDGIEEFARESDFEFHFRSSHGKLIQLVMEQADPETKYYIRSGSSSAKGVDATEVARSKNGSILHIIPDLEGIRHPHSHVLEAVEIKPEEIFTNVTMYQGLRVKATNKDLSDLEALEAQIRRCPGYAYRFVWPEENVDLRASDAMIVQVSSAMYYKKLLFYELSSSSRSVFFWRRSLDSTTLYFSRTYTMAEDIEDPKINSIDCKTNLARFAMRYLAGHKELHGEFAKLVPPPRKDHWVVAERSNAFVGVDSTTSWKYGKGFYPECSEGMDPVTLRRSDRNKNQKGPTVYPA